MPNRGASRRNEQTAKRLGALAILAINLSIASNTLKHGAKRASAGNAKMGEAQASPAIAEGSPRLLHWEHATRIIASRYPPIDLFERVSPDPAVWDALIAAEMMVNPRVRDEIGEIRLVPAEDRISGPNASYVMSSFTHVNPQGSRFSDGSYGVYYAARDFVTALRETAYHFARIAQDSDDGPRRETMRVLVGKIEHRFDDVGALPAQERTAILDANSYAASQPFGKRLREAGSHGVAYPSVRNAGGQCVGAFRPRAVGIPVQTKHLQYHWDGKQLARYFDYGENEWRAVWA